MFYNLPAQFGLLARRTPRVNCVQISNILLYGNAVSFTKCNHDSLPNTQVVFTSAMDLTNSTLNSCFLVILQVICLLFKFRHALSPFCKCIFQ